MATPHFRTLATTLPHCPVPVPVARLSVPVPAPEALLLVPPPTFRSHFFPIPGAPAVCPWVWGQREEQGVACGVPAAPPASHCVVQTTKTSKHDKASQSHSFSHGLRYPSDGLPKPRLEAIGELSTLCSKTAPAVPFTSALLSRKSFGRRSTNVLPEMVLEHHNLGPSSGCWSKMKLALGTLDVPAQMSRFQNMSFPKRSCARHRNAQDQETCEQHVRWRRVSAHRLPSHYCTSKLWAPWRTMCITAGQSRWRTFNAGCG